MGARRARKGPLAIPGPSFGIPGPLADIGPGHFAFRFRRRAFCIRWKRRTPAPRGSGVGPHAAPLPALCRRRWKGDRARARPRQSRPNCNPPVAGIGEIHPKTLAISANAVGFSLPMVYPSGGTRRWTAWQFFYTISSDGSSLWLFKPSSKTPIASAFERKVALGCERSVKTLV